MRVLLFTSIFPTPDSPGRGIFSAYRFAALSRRCATRAIVPLPWWAFPNGAEGWLRARRDVVHLIETDYVAYWGVPRLALVNAGAMAVSVAPAIRRVRRGFPFDAILSAWAYPDAVAAALLARRFGCPLVTMVLGSDINEIAQRPSLRAQTAWGLRQANRVIAVSSALRDGVLRLGVSAGRVSVQHNGVDGDRFALTDRSQARARLGLLVSGKLVCYIGNLVHEKGVDLLPYAMEHVRSAGLHGVRLVVVGDGPLQTEMRAAAGKLGLLDEIVFCGKRPHSEIPDWMAACDVLVLPSRREGCPNVILEALASGRPVVGARVGGVPELLSTTTGVLVDPEDPAALGAGIRTALATTWSPSLLRGSVQSLSWDDYGLALRRAVQAAIDEHATGRGASTGSTVSRTA